MEKNNKKIIEKIVRILQKHGITRAGIFGSYATGKAGKKSDIDILVEFDGSLLDLVGLEMELKKTIKKNIDLLTYKGVNPLLRERILGEEIRII